MANWTITVHKHDGDIERSIVTADTEAEARAKFEAQSVEFIVSIHRIFLPDGYRLATDG